NSNTVKNCYTKSNNPVVKEGTEAVDSYYADGTTYTKKDFSNGKIAGLLNKNVTQANKEYMDWAVVDKETVNQKSYIASFDLTSNSGKVTDAIITLYDSEGNEINATSSKNFMLEDGTFRLVNGQYKYKIAADRYEVKMGSLKVAGENVTVSEKLTDAYQVLFNITPDDATLTVKDSEGNVIVPSEGTKYFLSDGNYTYEVKKIGYEAQEADFEVKGEDLSFDVELQNVYKVSFAPNVSNARDFKIEVYKGDKLVTPQEDGTYLLTNGKYTYKASARGYAEINNEFEVASAELGLTVPFATEYDTSWYDSSKTSFEISTPEQLAGLGAIVNGYAGISDQFNGKTITLTQDINVDETLSGWLPIGTSSKSFQGTFDGGNHTITVKINAPNEDNVGLFGYLSSNGSVNNVTVDGSIVGKNTVGAVVGYQSFCKDIKNCTNKATVTGQNQVGGIVGNHYVYMRTVENCVNEGEVNGNTSVGGICGYMGQGTAKNCSNKGNVTAESQVGGIVGTIQGTSEVSNVSNSGNVTANSDFAGGF
ncbi:GLUG motif-containing protein, partial [Intestinibacter sp.]|uniref:GLUG motif-containing protein n=1 Tax=Intestinibacter sp. TaxID=1965304 RepID=UPI003F17B21C